MHRIYVMKILSVVGARPQFIKAAPVSTALRAKLHEVLVHTGQHYDAEMSDVFFREMGTPAPDYYLGIGSGRHGQQTGAMLAAIEDVILKEEPDRVLVYGDTNSTLAGALAAIKLHVPVAHVEAGLRSFNRAMPEEINRVLTDHCADMLFCPTQTAVNNLAAEGIRAGVHCVGDVMVDALRAFLPHADERAVLGELGLESGSYVLATVHRASNTDDPAALQAVLDCLAASPWPVVLPLHPRTTAAVTKFGLSFPAQVRAIKPVSYLWMLALEKNARAIMTDSGGVQKEVYMLGVPCITLRSETEWVETLAGGWNILAGTDAGKVSAALARPLPAGTPPPLFGDGTAARQIARIIADTQGASARMNRSGSNLDEKVHDQPT